MMLLSASIYYLCDNFDVLPANPHSLLWVMHSCLFKIKTQAFALLVEGWSVICVTAELKITKRTIYKLKTTTENLRLGAVPVRKPGCGVPRMMSPCTNKVLA
ncbi:hypothetical protein E2C01_050172 [Portunus trituberculatus]|uniref:Uncharacterized protein n=1 Tax=Portunus trituberculatus TaxID=210409 RepID=A0A5B7GFC6_PORTR|nr:hypothetical protein [Portunus trituberculatus]